MKINNFQGDLTDVSAGKKPTGRSLLDGRVCCIKVWYAEVCLTCTGKEFEMKPQNVYPGILSSGLREALGMDENAPPPWLINMQRYGPPPSYPSLKIPGLNAPIPPGAEFGYQAGQWGKPPVDEAGNPVYGDVFGLLDDEVEDLDPEVCVNAGDFVFIMFSFCLGYVDPINIAFISTK